MGNTDRSDLLIVFMKNPVIGMVKSRLAMDVGKLAAWQIYVDLVARIQQTTQDYKGAKCVFYDDFIDEKDDWSNDHYRKFLQQGNNIGECMNNSIKSGFNFGSKKVVLIGSDIPNLDLEIINTAFYDLDDVDVVLGPATDGGYYLIGLKSEQPYLFEGISWSTNNVLETTLTKCKTKGLTTSLLPKLTDVDTLEDIYLLHEELRDHYLRLIENSAVKNSAV